MSREDTTRLYDLLAEREAVACLLGLPEDLTDDLRRSITAEDLSDPFLAEVWRATCEAIADGDRSVASVAGRLVDRGLTGLAGDLPGERAESDKLVAGLELFGSRLDREIDGVAARVVKKAAARRAFTVNVDANTALTRGENPYVVVANQVNFLRDLRAADGVPAGMMTGEELLALEDGGADWVIPGLLSREDRVVVVGHEGSGKSVLLRQIAETSSQGLHPFKPAAQFTPIRALVIDLENPVSSVRGTVARIRGGVKRNARDRYDDTRLRYWMRPEGLDPRSAPDRRDLLTAIRHHQPDLVCMGPAYHMLHRRSGEDLEEATMETLNELKETQVRFGFALLLETHAPHGAGGSSRELRPIGSSAWKRWPEMGISLQPAGPVGATFDRMNLERFRGDRELSEPRDWPSTIVRATAGCRPWGLPDDWHQADAA